MISKIFVIVINFIISTIKLNSLYIGIMNPPIIHPSGKFYDFIENQEIIEYSKVNLTKYIHCNNQNIN